MAVQYYILALSTIQFFTDLGTDQSFLDVSLSIENFPQFLQTVGLILDLLAKSYSLEAAAFSQVHVCQLWPAIRFLVFQRYPKTQNDFAHKLSCILLHARPAGNTNTPFKSHLDVFNIIYKQ